jgi:hypothetical protein
LPGAGAPVAGAAGAVTAETTAVAEAVVADTAEPPPPEPPPPEPPPPEPPPPEPPPPEPLLGLTGWGTVAKVTDAAADVTAERAEPAPEPVLAPAGCGVVAAEAGGAEEAELAGAPAKLAGGAGAGAAEPAAEPVPAAAGGGLVEGGGALVPEAAALAADVAWETACPAAGDPAPEPPWDAPDVACVAVETADPSADDRPPPGELPPPGLDAADAEPAVRNESPMARPMAAAATPAAYRHSRRTVVTTLPATSGNLARDSHDVHVRERPQSGQMSTRLPLIPSSRRVPPTSIFD